MAVFTYARVSTADQNTDLQRRALNKKYPNAVYREEKQSGTSMHKREVLRMILDMIGQGDKLVVWKLDRLARNMNDLTSIVELLREKGADLEILDQNIDTGSVTGRAFLQMLGVFAEFETGLRKERQMAGIAAAQARGKKFGRRAVLDPDQKARIQEGHAAGTNVSTLARNFGVSRGTIYNVLRKTDPHT